MEKIEKVNQLINDLILKNKIYTLKKQTRNVANKLQINTTCFLHPTTI